MFASFCFDHILFGRLYVCVLSWWTHQNSAHFRSLYGNNLCVTLLSVFNKIFSYSVMEGSPRYPFFWLWVGNAPFFLVLPGSCMSSPARLVQRLAVLPVLLCKSLQPPQEPPSCHLTASTVEFCSRAGARNLCKSPSVSCLVVNLVIWTNWV